MFGVGNARASQWRDCPAGSTGRQGEQGICGQAEFCKPGVCQSGLTVLPSFWMGEGREERAEGEKLGWAEPGPLRNLYRNRDTLIDPSTSP